jgi:hypothetical protein
MGLFGNYDRGFDHVEIDDAGGKRRLTKGEFEALPLDQRVRAILSKQLKFFRGEKEIPMRDALADR